jgi:RNA polymerase sigma factor (TIGR02999 family)
MHEEYSPGTPEITALLKRWQEGDAAALEGLMPLVYRELHVMASRYLSRERPDHTLQSTALVHEAFMKLVDQRQVNWQSRAHFFGLAAKLMRRILVDHARRVGRAKRGNDGPKVSLDDAGPAAGASPGVDPVDALTLDGVLTKLESEDPIQARIVELRFYGGLTVDDTAEVMGLSPATVKRDWAMARAWLYRELSGHSVVS